MRQGNEVVNILCVDKRPRQGRRLKIDKLVVAVNARNPKRNGFMDFLTDPEAL